MPMLPFYLGGMEIEAWERIGKDRMLSVYISISGNTCEEEKEKEEEEEEET